MTSPSSRFTVFSQSSLSVSYSHAGEHDKPALTHLHAPVAHLDFLNWHTVNSINSYGAGACIISTGIKHETVVIW